jgi:hypothetical protein
MGTAAACPSADPMHELRDQYQQEAGLPSSCMDAILDPDVVTALGMVAGLRVKPSLVEVQAGMPRALSGSDVSALKGMMPNDPCRSALF